MLDLEITTHCNLACRWCFVGRIRPERRHLPIDLAHLILEEAREHYGPKLHLTGGEPLLHPDLPALLAKAADCGYAEALLNTNGTLLTDQRLSELAASPVRTALTISLDGLQDDHERNRGPGSHAAAVAGIRRALDRGLPVTVFTIVTRASLARLDTFLDRLFDTLDGVQGVYLIPVGDISLGKDGSETAPLTPSQLVDLALLSAANLLDGRAVRILDYPAANLVYRAVGLPISLVGSHCTACTSRICIQADLAVTPCHPVWAPLGTYRPGNLETVRHSTLYWRIAGRRFEGCETCPDVKICGHCRAAVLASTGRLMDNDWICKAIREEIARRGPNIGRLARKSNKPQTTGDQQPTEKNHVAT